MFLISFYSLMVMLGTQSNHGAGVSASGDAAGGKVMTRNRLTLWFICCIAINSTTAQQIWNNTYIADRPVMLFSSVEADSNSYIITGGTYGYLVNLGKGLYGRINAEGNLDNYEIFVDSVFESYGVFTNSIIVIQNQIAFTGNSYTNIAYLLFCLADKKTDSIKIHRYYTPNTLAYHGYSVAYTNSHYFVTGVKTDSSTNNPNVCFVKIDTNGVRVMEMNYGTTWYEQASSIIKLTNENLMIGALRSNLNLNPIVQKSNTWLLEVDTGGNIVRQWFDPSDSTYVAEGLRQTQDGGFIYGAKKKYRDLGGGLVSYTNSIVKMDSNFNKQWTYLGALRSINTGISDIEELPDGSFIACGQYPIYGQDSALWGCIIKLDVNGNVIWERNYRGINESQTLNFLSDIDVLPDGGLIAVGQCQKSGATPPQVGWFLKLDSNGCEVENCLLGIDEVSSQKQIQLYPNPTKSSFQVKLPDDMPGAVVAVYDVSGALVTQAIANGYEALVDVQGLSNGLYVVVATSSISPEGEEQYKSARAKLIVE